MTVTLASISLPADIVWLDEFDPAQVAQATERTLDGAIVIEETALQAGRPVTLGGGVWVPRSTVLALRALEAMPGKIHSLDLRGTLMQVVFRRPDAITARPVFAVADADAADPYDLELRLLTV